MRPPKTSQRRYYMFHRHPGPLLTPSAKRSAGSSLAVALLIAISAGAADAQNVNHWESTLDRYDGPSVEAHLEVVRGQLAERHGSLARTLFDMNEALMVTPHGLSSRPRPPAISRIHHRIEPAHLVHFQAENGGTLGTLHGSTAHPIGLTWFPHSMFAQSGRVFGQWGHARLLAGVVSHTERHSD